MSVQSIRDPAVQDRLLLFGAIPLDEVSSAVPTVVTKARFGLVTVLVESSDGQSTETLASVTIDGEVWIIVDIAMRMLTPRELARCQGFPDSYVLTGTKSDQVARVGNSVSPQVAAAVVAANLPRTEDRDQLAAK